MTDVLVDSNIWLYAFDPHSPFHARAVNCLQDPLTNLFISPKNISEFFAVNSKLGVPLLQSFQFYKNDMMPNSRLLLPNSKSISSFELLLNKYNPKGNRVYDIEIVSIMPAHGVKQVATFNISDFSNLSEISIFPL